MPVPAELRPFFTNLVEKSKRSEINWEAEQRADAYRVRFPDFSIVVSQDSHRHSVQLQLLNDRGGATTVLSVEKGDEEWLAAVSLINSANRKVRKIDHTLRRAMEELSKSGAVGLGAEVG